MIRVILHMDMDAFFASVEQRDQPQLRGKPVVVGSPPTQRGVVAAASYEARRFGIRSAMPSATAGRLCPKAVFVRPRMERYKEESARVIEIVARNGAVLEPMSIDEAYMDASEVLGYGAKFVQTEGGLTSEEMLEARDRALREALPLAREVKRAIRQERGLTATIGIAANKLLAKLASDYQKPDGLTLIPERDKVAFLRPLPVRALHGVGHVTEEVLLGAGISTIGDLQDYRGDLRALVGSFAKELKEYALGEDDRPLELDETIRSISSEETFLKDTEDRKVLRQSLRQQAEDVRKKLERHRLEARTVQVKVRYGDFTILTRQLTVDEPIDQAAQIYRLACYLLGKERLVSRPLRLLGLGVSHLDPPGPRQLHLWQEE